MSSASVPEIEPEISVSDQPESMMPVIRKKESDHLGMFEYRRDQEQAILKSLIYGKFDFITYKFEKATIVSYSYSGVNIISRLLWSEGIGPIWLTYCIK